MFKRSSKFEYKSTRIGISKINTVWCDNVVFVIDEELGTMVMQDGKFVGFMCWGEFDAENGIIGTSQKIVKLNGNTLEWREVKKMLAKVEFEVFGKTAHTAS